MLNKIFSRGFLLSEAAPLGGIALLKVSLHFFTNNTLLGYGYFRDELYYWVCAVRLDWGYVDHPPLAPLLLRINSLLFGDSLFAMRLLPALTGGALVLVTGLMVKALGGGKFSQCLAALAVTFAPIYLVLNGFFSPNAFEVLIWASCAYVLLRLFQFDKPQLWPWVGLLAGIGLETKHTTVLFGLGLVIGLLLTPAREYFRSKWLWLGGSVAFLITLPHILWQVHYGWPSLEFFANATLVKNVPTPPLELILTQILILNPLTFPIWLAGLFFLFTREGKTYRPLGWIYLTVLLVLIVTQSSRPDRIAGAYPALFASGAFAIEQFVRKRDLQWLGGVQTAAVVLAGIALLPLGIPVLPPESTAKFVSAVGLRPIERGRAALLPQYFADRFGWEEMVATVADVYGELPPEEQAEAVIFTSNYGEAGAIDFFGRAYDLPPAISGQNNYYLWGPGDASGEVVIVLGLPLEDVRQAFEEVKPVGTFQCDICQENNVPIHIAKHPKFPIQDLWPQVKHYE